MLIVMIWILFTEVTLILLSNSLVSGILNDTNIDRLSPAEFARLVLKLGKRNKGDKEWRGRAKKFIHQTPEITTELSDDETRLKRRKVWSRWSKWSVCSVTCGRGVMSRERVCLEGRCAPGEHEQQCRPCARSPCHAAALPDDTHDLE